MNTNSFLSDMALPFVGSVVQTTAAKRPMWFDPNTVSFEDDPYRVYRRMRDEFPYHHDDGERPLWILSRYADVSSALEDWPTFTSVNSTSNALDIPRLAGPFDGPQLITTDPPYHDELRRVVKDHFSPKRVQALEERIVGEAITSLEPSIAQDG